MNKLTRWYPIAYKPVRVGLYQVKAFGEVAWCWWDGEHWGLACITRNDAKTGVYGKHSCAIQSKVWRGVRNVSN
jgi:hypothetical protein